MTSSLTNGANSPTPPIQLSFTLPQSPQVRIHLHLTISKTNLLLFLTTTSADIARSSCALGSFVYAMPNRINASITPLSTPLYTQPHTLDFATRMAKVLARKCGKPVYVGNSMDFSAAGRGGDVEEEMEGFRMVVQVVMLEVERFGDGE